MRFPPPLRTSVSIRAARMPRPGAEQRGFAWDDVLETQPPTAQARHRGGRFVVRHGFDEAPDADARIGFATIVDARTGVDGASVRVDERIVVEARILSPVLRVERRVSRRLAAGSETGARLVTSGSEALARRMPERAGVVVERGGGLVARSISWLGETLRGAIEAVVHAPDRLVTGAGSAGAHLGARRERRAILRGLADPYSLTREGKAAALFLAGILVLSLLMAATLAVVFAAPQYATAWRALAAYFALGVGSTVAFPFFPEFQLDEVASVAGAPLAILAVSLGMTTGAWLVLFLGDAIHATLRRSVSPGSPLERVLDRAEAFARRRGFWAAFLPLAIPLGPDTPIFYLLATVRTPTRLYLLGTLLGTLTRFTLYALVAVSGAP